MIRTTFLGTSASQPTLRRNVSAISLQREGEGILFDCGEGTQRQIMRYGTGFGFKKIFVTHLHADHCLGITGLLRTMGLQGRTDPMHIYGPPGSKETLEKMVSLGVGRVRFEVSVEELEAGDSVKYTDFRITAFRVQHSVEALGYALLENKRLGRFDVEKARSLGVPEGPLFSSLHSGEAVELDGRRIEPEEVVGPGRAGRKIVYSGDTRPTEETIEISKDAQLLIHEATFAENERMRAEETLHSTAKEAAIIARDAQVSQLVLTHISARYSDNPSGLVKEAQSVFHEANVARDGQVVEIPY